MKPNTQSLIHFFSDFAKLIAPILGATLSGFLLLLITPTLGATLAFWIAAILAIGLMTWAFLYYHQNGDIFVAYGCAIASAGLLYSAVYQAFVTFKLFAPMHVFWALTAIALAAAYASVRFQGWLLAVLAIAMAVLTPSIVLGSLTRTFLAWYFMCFLAVVMLIAYWRNWFELAILSFLGYLIYNPLLFAITDLEGKKKLLSIYHVFWIMGAVFCIYTMIPYLYSFFRTKKRIFEAVSITIGGAYSFALSRHVIHQQLSVVEQLPFFVKFLAGKTPLMNDIHLNMFILFGLVYAAMFILLFIVNRRAKVVLSILASLTIICTIGAFYAQRQATGFIRYFIRLRHFLVKAFRMLAR